MRDTGYSRVSILIKPTFGLCNQQIDDSEEMVLEILFRSLPCMLNAHWSISLICISLCFGRAGMSRDESLL